MAKFTATVPLKIKWNGLEISGAAGVTHRIPDAFYEEFAADVEPNIPGGVTWVSTDELGAISTPAHSTLTGVTANQHHAQVHSISGADHTGTLTHAALGSVTADQHHAQVHSISGADHTGTLTHAALGSVTADQHHARSHDHSSASDGSTLSPVNFELPGSTVELDAGTSFPGSPTADDLCYRTDLNGWFFYDGTRWLSVEQVEAESVQVTLSATTSNALRSPVPHGPGDIWIVDHEVVFQVLGGGTALGASHKWDGTWNKTDSAGTQTAVRSGIAIDSGSSAVWRRTNATVGASVAPATYFVFETNWTKTGTPGNLVFFVKYRYRFIAT